MNNDINKLRSDLMAAMEQREIGSMISSDGTVRHWTILLRILRIILKR